MTLLDRAARLMRRGLTLPLDLAAWLADAGYDLERLQAAPAQAAPMVRPRGVFDPRGRVTRWEAADV